MFTLFAGPCVIESEALVLRTAGEIREICGRNFISDSAIININIILAILHMTNTAVQPCIHIQRTF